MLYFKIKFPNDVQPSGLLPDWFWRPLQVLQSRVVCSDFKVATE
jgi:hypothetical protein